jgi:hypothetical protein
MIRNWLRAENCGKKQSRITMIHHCFVRPGYPWQPSGGVPFGGGSQWPTTKPPPEISVKPGEKRSLIMMISDRLRVAAQRAPKKRTTKKICGSFFLKRGKSSFDNFGRSRFGP